MQTFAFLEALQLTISSSHGLFIRVSANMFLVHIKMCIHALWIKHKPKRVECLMIHMHLPVKQLVFVALRKNSQPFLFTFYGDLTKICTVLHIDNKDKLHEGKKTPISCFQNCFGAFLFSPFCFDASKLNPEQLIALRSLLVSQQNTTSCY